MSFSTVEEGQKKLQKIEERLAEVEEEAGSQFRQWYDLQDERNSVVEDIRSLVRSTPFEGKSCDYGTFNVRKHTVEEADVSAIRRGAAKVFALPGVVTKVDIKALRSAIELKELSPEEIEVVKEAIEKVERTPRVFGPKKVEF